jgi:glycosyltransferase involved in cell wall biosynthesis
MASIVIPAHNEERQIGRCLGAILAEAEPDEFDVVVVCNGCDDRTTEIARGFEPAVRVIELPEASKRNALNVGDAQAGRFPRLYIDGDSEIETAGVRELVRALEAGALVAYPRARPDLEDVSRGVRMYYETWRHLCYARHDLIGAGAYALSEEGRARFADFPAVIADDFFVRRLFRREETAVVEADSTIRPPRSVRALVQVKTRVFRGNRECERRYGDLFATIEQRPSFLAVVGRRPRLWLPALAYGWIQARAKLRARRPAGAGHAAAWSRDDTARSRI